MNLVVSQESKKDPATEILKASSKNTDTCGWLKQHL